MFERFTDRARRVIVLAQEEARGLNHNYIGTEHILLGLIHEGEGVAAKALESMGISLEAVRQEVEEIIGQGTEPPVAIFLLPPALRKSWNYPCAKACKWAINTLAPNSSCLASSVRAKAWPPRCW